MKKLFIFGNSYGLEVHNHPLKSFHNMLREYNYFETVFSVADYGQDLWSQFVKFKKFYTGTEEIIFFETNPGWLTVDCEKGTCVGLTDAIQRINTDPEYEIFTHFRDYYTYLVREDYDTFVNECIISQLKLICPTVLIIPCFKHATTLAKIRKPNFEPMELGSITYMENNAFLQYGDITDSKYTDLRRNHLIEENHAILAEQIIEYYKYGTPLDFNKYVSPARDDFSKYFIIK